MADTTCKACGHGQSIHNHATFLCDSWGCACTGFSALATGDSLKTTVHPGDTTGPNKKK
jgi:hypothetical protein